MQSFKCSAALLNVKSLVKRNRCIKTSLLGKSSISSLTSSSTKSLSVTNHHDKFLFSSFGGAFSTSRRYKSSWTSQTDFEIPSIKFSSKTPADFNGDLLLFPVAQEDASTWKDISDLAAVDDKVKGSIAELFTREKNCGKSGTVSKLYWTPYDINNIALIGFKKGENQEGEGEEEDYLEGQGFSSIVGEKLKHEIETQKPEKLGIVIPDYATTSDIQYLVESVLDSLYIDNRYRIKKTPVVPLKEIELFFNSKEEKEKINIISRAKACAEGARLAKDVVNGPANHITPAVLAEVAATISKDWGMDIKILEREECEKMGMGAYLGVAKGSDLPPKFIHLTYRPPVVKGKQINKKIAIIGKGLTFDSGGYNIKAGAGSKIELMKYDMGGSAATLGAARAIGELKPEGVEVHFIVAACENMVSGGAMRPGDILVASNGKTIEITNTDAEGRLTLADALVYAENQKVDTIVDLATLTGACVVALGGKMAGYWSSNNKLASALMKSSEKTKEKIWQMPLPSMYKHELKSTIADLKNSGSREGGSITAALFLKEFVKSTPWAHIDIAGPTWGKKGATGYGVKLLVDFITTK